MNEPIDSYLQRWTISELIAAYQRRSSEPGDEEAERIRTEMERRNLDICPGRTDSI